MSQSRFRSKHEIKSLPAYGQSIWLNGSNTTWQSYPPSDVPVALLNGEEGWMLDFVTPRFHKRSAAGEVFFNNKLQEKVTIETKASGFLQQNQIVPSLINGVPRNNGFRLDRGAVINHLPTRPSPRYGVWPEEVPVVSQADINRMKVLTSTAVLSKRGRSDSDLWESIAEYRQTLDLLKRPLSELVNKSNAMLTSIQRSTASRRLLKEVSSAHLLYRYGITPLMKDIASIAKTLERTTGKQRKTSRANESHFAVQREDGYTMAGACKVLWTRETRENIQVRGMSLDEVDLSLLGNVGFSLKGLITLPYELVTYSFVADWFFNFGDYLGARAPAFGYNQLGSSLTTTVTRSTLYTITGTDAGGTDNWVYTGSLSGTCAIVRQSSTRSGLTHPGVTMRNNFKLDSFSRAADATALIASRFVKINNLVGPTPVGNFSYKQKQLSLLWLNQPGLSK